MSSADVIVCSEVEGIRERSACRERSVCRERPLCREGSVCAQFERALGLLDAGFVVPLLGDEVPFEDTDGEAGAVIFDDGLGTMRRACSPSGSAAEPALGSSTPPATAFKFAFPAEARVRAQRRDPQKALQNAEPLMHLLLLRLQQLLLEQMAS